MRYPRPKPSIALAAIAAAVVASPFVVIASQSEPQLVDNKQTVSNTEIEQVPLRELPAAIVDVATSGLAAAGVELPPIDPDAFPLPDLTVPLPKGLVPGAGASSSTDPSAPSGSPSVAGVIGRIVTVGNRLDRIVAVGNRLGDNRTRRHPDHRGAQQRAAGTVDDAGRPGTAR